MSPKTAILVIAGIVVVLGIVAVIILQGPDPTKGVANLQFWGVFDDSDVYTSLIKEFNKTYKNVSIVYHKKSIDTYEEDLVNALASGSGPDIFFISNSWLPKHINKLAPMTAGLMTLKDYQDTFADVAVNDFIAAPKSTNLNQVMPEQIYAVPLYIDTLALYWNKDIFNAAGIGQPPKTWPEFSNDVIQLTQKDQSGNILQSGVAMGTGANVNRSSDILSLLMLQTGTQMVGETKADATFDQSVYSNGQSYLPGESSLGFYTDFANPKKQVYCWNNQMDYSIDAFAEGRAAMMLNYDYNLATVRAKQPHLNFGVSAMPQPGDAKILVNFANYWGLSVSNSSSDNNKYYAWIFINWLTQKAQAQKYLEATQRPAARRDLIDLQKSDVELGVFAQQALTAKSWYQADPSRVDAIFITMIDSVAQGVSPADALHEAAKQVTLLMQKL